MNCSTASFRSPAAISAVTVVVCGLVVRTGEAAGAPLGHNNHHPPISPDVLLNFTCRRWSLQIWSRTAAGCTSECSTICRVCCFLCSQHKKKLHRLWAFNWCLSPTATEIYDFSWRQHHCLWWKMLQKFPAADAGTEKVEKMRQNSMLHIHCTWREVVLQHTWITSHSARGAQRVPKLNQLVLSWPDSSCLRCVCGLETAKRWKLVIFNFKGSCGAQDKVYIGLIILSQLTHKLHC